MKFLPQEHQDIVELLTSNGFLSSQYSFRKKNGLVHIELEGRPESFVFFRKTESILSASLQFEDKITYFYGAKKSEKAESWQEVLRQLEIWL